MSKYKNSYYIAVASFKEFEKLSASREMADALPSIKVTHSKLEARTNDGRYFVEIDPKEEALLDKMMSIPSLKSRLLTNAQAQAIALKGLPI